ncbi:hypothetical protein Scani_13230 [Streptomyces caniferus]|uniref:Uncharacterized protein n=2 Tax=Streptomyces caniferus TaxID=285557 RepID=A0A640S607_9ACTN|nr:hypothetical protein Scani_13230 [Streptomyces caniferus]
MTGPAGLPWAAPGGRTREPVTGRARLSQTGVMSSPRRACPICTREIAVVGGRFARHDPPGRRTVLELISCPGSRRIAPMMAPAEKLFDPEEPPIPGQQPLF